jgi:phage/plasmid-like protein (TIGR03299 family)
MHNLDNSKGKTAFVSVAKPAWHGLGTIVNEALNAEQALQLGGLDFTVLKMPNVHMMQTGQAYLEEPAFIEIVSEDSFFTYRTDVNKVLGSRLGKDYTVLQNAEAFNIVDEILQAGTASIETAGAIDEGRKTFICLKANDSIIVNGNDKTDQYILICNSHDGSMAIQAMFTNVRVVCSNTLAAALGSAQDKIRIRHTANAGDRLKEAAKVLKLIKENNEHNTESYEIMCNTIIEPSKMWDYFGNLFLDAQEIKALQQGNPTMWTAYNAVTGYVTRKKYSSADDRANSMLFGSGYKTIQEAGVLALHPGKIEPLKKINSISNMNFN